MAEPLFQTQRSRVVALYKKAGQPFVAATNPYHSVRTIEGVVKEVDITHGVAWVQFTQNQRLEFFSYGVGDSITLGATANYQATEAETNLAKGKSTNGAADYVIEGASISCRSMLVKYAAGSEPSAVAPTDASVIGAITGTIPMWDPAGLYMPPQLQSPANLEQGIFQCLLPFLSLEFEWDRKRTAKLGTCDLLPQGGAASYLRANGVPASDNRFRIPEGFLWRRDGEADGEFLARVKLERDMMVPISLRNEIGTPATFHSPSRVYLEIALRVHGLEVCLPSQN